VVAEGPVFGLPGTTGRVVLGSFETISPKLALRWLREQARRISDGLDPSPMADWVPPTLLTAVTDSADVPAELRWWADDSAAQQLARDQLAAASTLHLSTRDSSGRYMLTARCVPSPAVPAPHQQDSPGVRSRASHHKKARRGWTRLVSP
jgi:hypothetical protein